MKFLLSPILLSLLVALAIASISTLDSAQYTVDSVQDTMDSVQDTVDSVMDEVADSCKDTKIYQCKKWAAAGRCSTPSIAAQCPKSCFDCCLPDTSRKCRKWAKEGRCETDKYSSCIQTCTTCCGLNALCHIRKLAKAVKDNEEKISSCGCTEESSTTSTIPITSTTTTSTPTELCQPEWTRYQDKCFFFGKERVQSWDTFEAECNSMYGGSHLPSIGSKEEQDFIVNNLDGRPWLSLGGTDAKSEGQWTWLDGRPWGFTSWQPGQPDGGSEDCVVMVSSNGGWHDYPCGGAFKSPLVCSYRLDTVGGEVTSPNFPSPYPKFAHTSKTILVAPGKAINIHFTDFILEANCYNDYVTITDGDGSLVLHRSCGNTKPADVSSVTNKVIVTFKSNKYVEMQGFRLTWTAV